jgi:hypothetical protein
MVEPSVELPAKRRLRDRLAALGWMAALSVFAIVFCWDLITNKRALLHPDFYTYYFSFRVWFYKALAAGHFPLWNPNWGLGHPAEVWATIPLDPYTLLELIFGPRYGSFQAVQAVAILGSVFFALTSLGIPRVIAAATAVLFFVSPWTNYFFFYFLVANSVIAYVLLFYFLLRWLETDQWRYVFYIGWATFLSMFGTKLEFWFFQTAILGLLSILGPFLVRPSSAPVTLARAAWPLVAIAIGIAAQAWQLDILLRLMADSTRELDHHLSAILELPLWRSLAGSVRDSAFLQLAAIGGLLLAARDWRRPQARIFVLLALAILVVTVAFPSHFSTINRDGGMLRLLRHFVTSPILAAAIAAAIVDAIVARDRDWRARFDTTIFYLAFVYYFCRSGPGDLREIYVLNLTPATFQFAMGFMVWLGCRSLASNAICRLAYASIILVFLMRDQGQILLAATVGWQWIPTRDGYIIEFGFIVLAACGVARLAPRDAGFWSQRPAWLGSVVALAAVASTLFALRHDLYQTHACVGTGPQRQPCGLLLVGKTPADYPYFEGIASLRDLFDQLHVTPPERLYFANNQFMDFYHFMGTALLANVEQVTIYASLTSSRYREWSIFQNLGIRPEERWRAYANELTPGTVARLPPVNMLGYSNAAVYDATLISRPPPRRGVLELLGVGRALRLYPGARHYVIGEGNVPTDSTIVSLAPLRLQSISGDIATPNPMFLADMNPLPRAFVIVPPSPAALGELQETMSAEAKDGRVVVASYALPVTAAHIVDYQPEHVVIDADASAGSVLVLSDLYHPFWSARVDGEPAAIIPMFHIMRGVALSAGHHRVEFFIHVPGLALATIASGVIVLLSVGCFWCLARVRGIDHGMQLPMLPLFSSVQTRRNARWRQWVGEASVVGFFVYLALVTLAIHNRPTLMQDQSLTFDHWWYFYNRLQHGSLAQWNPYSLVGRIAVQWNYVPASIFYLPLLLKEPRIEWFPFYNALGTFFAYLGVYVAVRLAGYGRFLPLLPVILLAASGYRYWADFLHFASYLTFFPVAMVLLVRAAGKKERMTTRQWALIAILIALAFAGLRLEKIVYASVFTALAVTAAAAIRTNGWRDRAAFLVEGLAALAAGLGANAWQLAYLFESTADNLRLSLGFDLRQIADPLLFRWMAMSILHQPAMLPIAINAIIWIIARKRGRDRHAISWHYGLSIFAVDALVILTTRWLLDRFSIIERLYASSILDHPQAMFTTTMLIAGALAMACCITLSRRMTVSQWIGNITAIFLGMSVSTYSWEVWPLHMQAHFFFLPPHLSPFIALGALGLALSRRWWMLFALFVFHFIAETASLPMWQVAHIPWNAPRAALAETAFQAILMVESVIVLRNAAAIWVGTAIAGPMRLLGDTWLEPAIAFPAVVVGAALFHHWVIPMAPVTRVAADSSTQIAGDAPAIDFPFATPPDPTWTFRNDWIVEAAHESRMRCTSNVPHDPQHRTAVPDTIMNFEPHHPVFRFLPAYGGCLNTAPAYASEIPGNMHWMFEPHTGDQEARDVRLHPESSPMLGQLANAVSQREGQRATWYFSDLLVSAHEGTDIVGRTLSAEAGSDTQRAFTVHRVAVFPDRRTEREALKRQLENGEKLSDLLTTSDPAFHGGNDVVTTARDTVEFLRDSPEQIVLRVNATAPGYLALLDLWSRGWTADNNGVPLAVYRGYVGMRFVSIPAGSSVITFRYHVPGLPMAGAISVLIWIGLIGGIVSGRGRIGPLRRRHARV